MTAMLIRRLAGLAATLLALSIAIFTVMDLLPGDPASIMLGTSASPDTLAALRERLGLDRPLPLRYLGWLFGLAGGDFGVSVTYGVPAAGLMLERMAVTLPLAAIAIVLSVAIAVPLGVFAARHHDRGGDFAVGAVSHLAIAVPAFWIGLLLIMVFSSTLRWLPAGGFPGWDGGAMRALRALLLPAIALALPQAGVLIRVTRSALLEVMGADFLRTARAKGLGERGVMWRHALRHALIPVITMIGLQFTFLVAGAVLVENVFDLPGLGRLAVQALAGRDVVVLQNVVLLFAALAVIVNFLAEIAHWLSDPRLRTVK